MSGEKELPEPVGGGSKPAPKFIREYYDRLMSGQKPWLAFLGAWEGEGDPWESFERDSPKKAEAIRAAIATWNAEPQQPSWLEGADLSWAHLKGAYLIQAYLDGARLTGANLEGADLTGAHLEGAYLNGAHLEGAHLIEAHLEGAYLTGAHLEGAYLIDAHLEGADLTGANLQDVMLLRCDLKTANLSNADLTDVTGLTAGQLAGADVTSATLPAGIQDFESLKVADEAAKNSRSLFLVMLLACVYSWLSLASTTDQALIMNTSSSPLPIIKVPVPTRGFFFVAPAFLLAVYTYFHLYLHGLWERLAELPAVFPDGRPLDRRAYPWLLTSLIRPLCARLQHERALFSKAKVGLSIVLGWWVVPFSIYLFWAQALAAHIWYMTALHLALFIGSLGVGVVTYRGTVATLRLENPNLPGWREMVREVAGARLLRVPAVPSGLVAILLLSAAAISGPVRLPRVPLLLRPYADLTGAQLSTRTEPRFEGDSTSLIPAVLAGRNFRFATMRRAYLEEANLNGADLRGADLLFATLREANLNGANLRGAQLDGANLAGASLFRADLRQADLEHANLLGAYMEMARLREANLLEVNLRSADLREADLGGADLTQADLREANLLDADLRDVDLTSADVWGVRGVPAGFWHLAATKSAWCSDPSRGVLSLEPVSRLMEGWDSAGAPPGCAPAP